MRLHYLQHVPFEGLGNIETWARARGWSISATRVFQHDPLPELPALDWLVVMGGPMGVGDEKEYPWLAAEKALIGAAIRQQKIVIGICLGAQLIANVLGARVYRNPHKEIGWLPIERTDEGAQHPWFRGFPASLEVFHWHGDTFDLPPGAVHLARSAACANQAFAVQRHVLALQFHLETTPAGIEALIEHCGDELVRAPYIQSAEQIRGQTASCPRLHDVMNNLLTSVEGTAG